MAGNALISKFLNRLSPFWRREIGFFALFFGFGLMVLPFLIYLAGVLTLGPYEGGLLTFLGSLMGAVFTGRPSAWMLITGPYLMFMAIRILTRPFRRQA
ncbi:MAG: hypothetical protein ACRER4_04105 [Steroidobacteraceae bacterium]